MRIRLLERTIDRLQINGAAHVAAGAAAIDPSLACFHAANARALLPHTQQKLGRNRAHETP